MLSLTRQLFVAAILLGIVSISLTARSQTQADKKDRTGSVSGRVTINGKGAPGIVVSLASSEFRSQLSPSLRDVTDPDGKYQITGVPAGKYQVIHLAPALIPKTDDSSFNLWGKLLLIAEGETVEGFDLALMRGAVITGRVTDASGQPLIEEPVIIEPADSTNRPSSGRFSGIDQHTDDRGIFRIFGLPPGRYRVAAGLSEDRSHRIATGQTLYKKTFHPNVIDPAKATIIELSEGAEVTAVDITVGQAIQSFSASGRIVHSETGRPIPNAGLYLVQMVVISEGHTGRNVSSIPRSNSQGEFRVENLIPGMYAVSPARDSDLRSSSIKFEVVDQDISGLIIKTSPGASVAGAVIIENPEKGTDKSKFPQLYISIQISGEDNEYGLGRLWSIKPDGGFRFGGLPAGGVQFSIGSFSREDSGYRIVRIERDGIVQPNEIQIQDGEQITGLRVVIVAGTATIRGTVKVENGPLPAGVGLHVQITKAGEQSPHMRSPDLDSRGTFMVDKLAPGSYELVGTAFAPSSRSVLGTTKQVVNVAEGGVTEVTLNIELKPNTKF